MCLTAHILEDVLLTTLLCLFAVDYRPGPPQPKVTRTTKPKVFLTDGRDIPLNGPCLVFTRMPGSANTSVTDQTISKVPVVWCLWMVISFMGGREGGWGTSVTCQTISEVPVPCCLVVFVGLSSLFLGVVVVVVVNTSITGQTISETCTSSLSFDAEMRGAEGGEG